MHLRFGQSPCLHIFVIISRVVHGEKSRFDRKRAVSQSVALTMSAAMAATAKATLRHRGAAGNIGAGETRSASIIGNGKARAWPCVSQDGNHPREERFAHIG